MNVDLYPINLKIISKLLELNKPIKKNLHSHLINSISHLNYNYTAHHILADRTRNRFVDCLMHSFFV